jgi:uncharacterized protein involved in outer membrane biogenesis
MPKYAKWALYAFGAFIVLALVSGLVVKSMVAGSAKDYMVKTASERLGVKVELADMNLDMGKWLQLQPSLDLSGLKIGNPPGYKSPYAIEAEKVQGRVALKSLMDGKPQILEINLDKPTITFEKREGGKNNLGELAEKASGPQKPTAEAQKSEGGTPQVAIEKIVIRGGQVKVVGQPVGSLSDIDITVAGFGTGRPMDVTLSAGLYGTKDCKTAFQGVVGPLSPEAMPLKGALTLSLAPNELPKDVLLQNAGDLFASPGEKSRVTANIQLEGDAKKSIRGPAKIEIRDLMIGKTGKGGKQLPMTGDVNGQWEVADLTGAPVTKLTIPDATVKLSSGTLKTSLNATSSDSGLATAIKGSISGIDVNEFLTAFANSPGQLYGTLTMPSFQFQAAGADSAAIQKSLRGTGSVSLSNGRIPSMDMVGSVLNSINKQGGGKSTEFAAMNTNFSIADEKLNLQSISMNGPGLKATGNGVVGFNESLRASISAEMTGNVAALMGKAPGAPAVVPIEISGTVSKPIVKPNTRSLVTQSATSLVDKYVGGKTGDTVKGLLGGFGKKK